MQAPDRPALTPNEKLMALHELHGSYDSFAAFQPELPVLLQQGGLLDDCITISRALGVLEPLSAEHIPPEALLIQGPNWRESLIGNGLLSRNRAVLWVLEKVYGSIEALRNKDIYLVEALTGFLLWLRRQIGHEHILCGKYLEDAEAIFSDIPHQVPCELTLSMGSLDLVLCNKLSEHVKTLELALAEIARVLKPGGRLVATCPLAFGQLESIIKAVINSTTGETEILGQPELHGDPVRPEQGYRIPGWEILRKLKRAGFQHARMHHIASWKHGILGMALPGVMVIEAQR